MNLLIWVCLALVAWPSAFAKYFTRKIDVFQPPTKNNRNNSYFGYSITYDEVYKKLVISAPRLSDIGEVYDCNIENQVCTKISRDIVTRDIGMEGAKNYKHDFWFGATVKAGRDYVLMCAPRYTDYVIRFGTFLTEGRCYAHQDGKLTPRKIITDKHRKEESPSKMEENMDSFGWSADIATDDTVIVGGPGMWRGRVMFYERPEVTPELTRKSKKIPKFNFGYAVASGTFIKDYLSYAVGSPYGPGEVLFYRRLNYVHKLEKKVDTDLVGSMFGAVLCAAKLQGKRTDLLVGAPTYATKDKYNLGAVYVYLALRIELPQPPQYCRTIKGEKPGSMFGSAIVNVGDINADNKDDIAIGAPFEDGHGVVYLYSGAALSSEVLDRELTYLQKIEPESSYGESFGMSLTPLLDYDGNGCKELAIGSPFRDRVVLLRCMAAVLVKTSVRFPNVQGRSSSGKTDFAFDLCLTVTYPSILKRVTGRIITTVEINHEYAKLVHTDGNGTVSFKTDLDVKRFEYCKKVPFILRSNGKYETEIRYLISSELEVDPMKLNDFESSRVILSDRSDLAIQTSLWAAECAGNKTCVPKLDLTPYISFQNVEPYIIGSSKKETMYITMKNDGEVAYDSCVRVHIDGANVLQPGGCVYEPSNDGVVRLMCEPSKPLWNNKSWTTGHIELEMIHLTNLHKSINITMILYNRCNDNHTVTHNETIPIILRPDPRGIIAKGETDIGAISNMTAEDIKENGKKIKHVYTISNTGPTTWERLPVQVKLQNRPFIKYDADASVTMFLSSSNAYTPCPFESEDAISKTYLCEVEILKANVDTAKILIPMYILPGTLEGLLDKDKNVTITSDIKLLITDVEHKAERTISTLTLQETPVPFETIIIAIVVGLCILIIIALILYRIGFLQRKKREELEKLRKSVKRQTILRRSTMPSQGQVAEDRRQILEDMKEEDEHSPNLSVPPH